MALFVDTQDRKREPLGGREADGFDRWLRMSTQAVSEVEFEAAGGLRPGNPMRQVAIEASAHYGRTLGAWKEVGKGQGGDGARDRFEVNLISDVVSTHGAMVAARSQERGPGDVTANGRPVAAIAAEYLRACTILAKYVGISELDVHACGDDQAKLMALRADQG